MPMTIRRANAGDGVECGRIIYAAFAAIAHQHSFPPDFPSVDIATGLASMLIADPRFYGVVAEQDGCVVGSNFLDERSPIGGIGPVTVDPTVQNKQVGRGLMQAVIEHATAQKLPSMRLVQDAYHNRSLCLYTKLGFAVREPLSVVQGQPLAIRLPGYEVRPATADDVATCNRLCRQVHGFERGAEVADAVARNTATVVEHLGRITGYATEIGFRGHAIGENNEDLKALIGAAPTFAGPGFLLPTRNHAVLGWCLGRGLRLVRQATLMAAGLYSEPAGGWLPSILY